MNYDFNIKLTETPTLQTYGSLNAEETVLLDLKMFVNQKEHDLKIKIYNTKCSMDIGAKGSNPEKKFEHLENFTAGEYFARKVIPEFVKTLSNKLNIEKLNEECRKLQNIEKCRKT